MNVTLADDAQMTDDLESCGPEHMIFVVGESLRRSHNNRVTSVRAERVKVLHVTADDGVLE